MSKAKLIRKRFVTEEIVRRDDLTYNGKPVTYEGEPVYYEEYPPVSSQKYKYEEPVEDVLPPTPTPTIKPKETPNIFLGDANLLSLDREFGRFHLYPPFFEILPGEESFTDAWEIFCCDMLNRHENTTEIARRKAPEGGIDLLWREKKRAYQCKSVIDPATNRFDVSKAVESVKAALAKRKETGWKKFYICSNVDITGPQERKLRDACPGVDMKLLTPSFWLPRCREQYAHLRNRFSELKRPHER